MSFPLFNLGSYGPMLSKLILASSISNLTGLTLDTAVAKGTWTASGTWTLPAFTLGGNVTINSKLFTGDLKWSANATIGQSTETNILTLTSIGNITFSSGIQDVVISHNRDDKSVVVRGGSDAGNPFLQLIGSDFAVDPGRLDLITPNATKDAGVLRLTCKGNAAQGSSKIIIYEPFMVNADSTNNQIWTASAGAASTTLYIGNAQITVSSDVRVKDNIRPYEKSALSLLKQLPVIEFDYHDDCRPFGGVYSDRYVGMSAQDLYRLFPWAVNTQGGKDCADCLAGRDCAKHLPWQVNHELLVGVLVKAIQELAARRPN